MLLLKVLNLVHRKLTSEVVFMLHNTWKMRYLLLYYPHVFFPPSRVKIHSNKLSEKHFTWCQSVMKMSVTSLKEACKYD